MNICKTYHRREGKDKAVHVSEHHIMNAYRGCGGKVPCILNLSARCSELTGQRNEKKYSYFLEM
jgi:hypothetical protein